MEFLLATNNKEKVKEFERLFQGSGHTFKSYTDLDINISPAENGKTFEENARIKANAGCEATGLPTIADDSGLVVDALNGAPGVNSARFAGFGATDEDNRRKLLSLLERMPFAKRGAAFECSIILAMPGGGELSAHGECRGTIGFSEVGSNGFGYDSLFLIGGKSFAAIEGQEKDRLSHRGLAVSDFLEKLPAFLEESGEIQAEE